MPVQMQVRRGTAAGWTAANPVLLAGEIGYETDTTKFKVGDGATVWSGLPYVNLVGIQGVQGTAGLDGEDGLDGMPVPGPQGPQGPTGATGPSGPMGLGIDGIDGEDGMGIPGPQGPAGAGGGGGSGIPIIGGTASAGKRVTWSQKAAGTVNATMTQVGQAAAALTGGGTTVIDANGFWHRLVTTGVIDSFAHHIAFDSFTAGSLLPKLVIRMRTGSDITSQRLLFSLNEQVDANFGVGVDVDSPGATQRGFYFRYSTAAGDTGWMAMSRDTAGLTTSAQIGANIVASTIYVLTITVKGAAQVTFDVNGTSLDITTNIPTTTSLGWQTLIHTLVAAIRQFDLESLYLESN